MASRKVLIVDDSPVITMSVTQILSMAGFAVETASDGMEALEKVKSGLKPDLIITDVNMPRMGGFDFIRNVRPILRFTPILVMTTESELSKREEARKLGATGWLVKPVDGKDLLSVVDRVLPSH